MAGQGASHCGSSLLTAGLVNMAMAVISRVIVVQAVQLLLYQNGTVVQRGSFTSKTKLNSVALVRERTIPTERPPPVGKVSANFCG